jgi:hypothetical protein
MYYTGIRLKKQRKTMKSDRVVGKLAEIKNEYLLNTSLDQLALQMSVFEVKPSVGMSLKRSD